MECSLARGSSQIGYSPSAIYLVDWQDGVATWQEGRISHI